MHFVYCIEAEWRIQALVNYTSLVQIMLIWPLGTNFGEILIEMHIFSFNKNNLKMPSGNWRPFCLGFKVFKYHIQKSHEKDIVTEKLRYEHIFISGDTINCDTLYELPSWWITSTNERSGFSIGRHIKFQSYLKFISELSLKVDSDGRCVYLYAGLMSQGDFEMDRCI